MKRNFLKETEILKPTLADAIRRVGVMLLAAAGWFGAPLGWAAQSINPPVCDLQVHLDAPNSELSEGCINKCMSPFDPGPCTTTCACPPGSNGGGLGSGGGHGGARSGGFPPGPLPPGAIGPCPSHIAVYNP